MTDTDLISEAGRKILRFHFLRMISHEAGTRQGDDIEELHDMRVASRRMRSALGTFRQFYQKKYHKRFRRDLRDIGTVLGGVRDIDVFLENLSQDQQILSQNDKIDLTALMQYWIAERDTARLSINHYFDGDGYQDFLKIFSRFLETSLLGVKKKFLDETDPLDVRLIMPKLINSHLARVQAIGYGFENATFWKLHQLRIEIKKLRYVLEFFSEILGISSQQLVDQLKQVQDHLGKLNDAVVAVKMVREFMDSSNWKGSTLEKEASKKYLQHKLAERDRLRCGFPDVWRGLMNSGFEDELQYLLDCYKFQ